MLNYVVLILSAVAAILSAVFAYFGEGFIAGGGSSIISIGVIFAASAGLFFLCMLIANSIQGSSSGYSVAKSGKTAITAAVIGIAAMMFVGALFEYIYEITRQEEARQVEDVVFVMDRSGSMSSTDPGAASKNALKEYAAAHEDGNGLMVIEYSSTGNVVLPLTANTRSSQAGIMNAIDSMAEPNGGTYIRDALDMAMDAIKNRQDRTKNVDVVIISDGDIADIGYYNAKRILKPFIDENISITTVGTAYVNERLMTRIASLTGGAFVMVDDFTDLQAKIDQALSMRTADNLLTGRVGLSRAKPLYGLMRILFLTLLGAAINTVGTMMVYCNDTSLWKIITRALIGAAAAAVLLELFADGYKNNWGLYAGFMALNMLSFVLMRNGVGTFRPGGRSEDSSALREGLDVSRKNDSRAKVIN